MNLAKRSTGMQRSARTAFLLRYAWRPLPFAVFAASAAYVSLHPRDVPSASPTPSAALASVLTARGFACEADDVTWTIGPSGLRGAWSGGARALVRASPAGEPNDLFLVEARLSPEGRIIEVGSAWNLTHTSGVDESRPLVLGSLVAFTTSAASVVTGVHTLDLAGRPPFAKDDQEFSDFTRVQRTQTAITNLQQTGQTQGVVHNAFGLDPPAERVELSWKDGEKLAVRADDRDVLIDARTGALVAGEKYVRAVPEERARPGNVVTWAVDRVRDIPWFGDEKMQWVKAIAFTGLDWIHATFAKDATAQDVKDEIGDVNSGAASQRESATFADPEIGWPPPDLTPLIKPALEGEGKWIALDKDPFVTQTPGAPAAFLTTFIRPNPKRLDLNVYVTLWDPRQIALHMVAGTVEPVSATGERGGGLIPRDPSVMKHVVAAFNGGFQAQHGEFGMQADHIVYLPPKPYAATVMEMKDGSTAFGSWPPAGPNGATIPDDILSYRQNLTALVEGGKFNPWQRTWWGGTPPGWGDNIHSARSALCLTKDGFVGYFYSVIISPDDLAAAEIAAGCTYGIHLDMNPGHAGFEFYDVAPSSAWQPLGRALNTTWEAEGKVPQMDGWQFRARRMIKGMGHMLFPRYIQREGRDFFYLTTRTVLPGAPVPSGLAQAAEGEGEWRVKGLPQHGFPYALATTSVHPDAHKPDLAVRVLRVDPRTLRVPGSAGTNADTPVVITFPGPPPAAPAPTRGREPRGRHPAPTPPTTQASAPPRAAAGESTLWFSGSDFVIAKDSPGEGAMALVTGQVVAKNATSFHPVRAAVGINDEEGMLTWVELPPDATLDSQAAAILVTLLEKMGCSTQMLVTSGARALLGGALEIDGSPATGVTATMTRLVRGPAPGAHLMFEDTALVPYSVWQPLQNQKPKLVVAPKQ